MNNHSKYQILFYQLSQSKLEQEIIKLEATENFFARQIAITILNKHKRGEIVLPIKEAAEIISASSPKLKQIIDSETPTKANVLALAKNELLRRSETVDFNVKTEKSKSQENNKSISCGTALILIIILSVIGTMIGVHLLLYSLANSLGPFLDGFFSSK
jgi:hypothetical protein